MIHDEFDTTVSTYTQRPFQKHQQVKQCNKKTNSLSKRSLMRSHPVLGNSGFPMFFGRLLDEGIATGAVLVKEEDDDEEEEEGICAGWAAATSAA